MSQDLSPQKEKILLRLSEDASLIQRRLDSLSRRLNQVHDINRKILILQEQRRLSFKAMKKEIKRNTLELYTFKGFVEGLQSKDQKAEDAKNGLLQSLEEIIASYEQKKQEVLGLDEDSPPDMEI